MEDLLTSEGMELHENVYTVHWFSDL